MNAQHVIPTDQNPDLVTLTVKVDGNAISGAVRLNAVSVYAETNRIPTARLVIYDGEPAMQDFPTSNLDIFNVGKSIEILAGYHSIEKSIFKGIIVKHSIRVRESQFQLVLECKHPVFRMTLNRRSRCFHDLKDSEAMESILLEYGLNPAVQASAIVRQEIVQYDLTDWDFLQVRAEANGMVCLANADAVSIAPPDLEQDPAVAPVFGGSIIELDLETDARQQPEMVKATAWDFINQEMAESESTEPNLPTSGQTDGPGQAAAIEAGETTLRHAGRGKTDDLQTWANAQLLRQRMARTRGKIVIQGNHLTQPGKLLQLHGVGNQFNGKAFISGVAHEISGGNWHAHVQLGLNPEPFAATYDIQPLPAAGRFGGVNGLATGLVTQLGGDPDGADRIRVHLPMLTEGSQGIWARQASLDAGNQRGAFFRPEIGDEVIVGFLNDDPNDAVVLGMLHSPDKPAPLPTNDDNNLKGFVSRSGIELLFDDEKKSLTLSTPGGRTLLLDDQGRVLKLEDENGNKIEFTTSGITIQTNGNLTLKAAANAELSGGAMTTVKGGIVKIN